jgi:hypothetical protein
VLKSGAVKDIAKGILRGKSFFPLKGSRKDVRGRG